VLAATPPAAGKPALRVVKRGEAGRTQVAHISTGTS